ncbi:CopG family transcriptional regulator [Lapillicoccus sp.]|uniref:CopG family transcriptional regulator n=1 Tax=Lapillicoccus sp. TaxID=1909287 RepID=UPI003982D6EB
MKTAISLPDATFEAATRRAAELGISRSQLFAVAARRYLDDLESASVTTQINDALRDAGSDDSTAFAVDAGRTRLSGEGDW